MASPLESIEGVKRTNMFRVPFSRLKPAEFHPNGEPTRFNTRTDFDLNEGFLLSIAEHGILRPLNGRSHGKDDDLVVYFHEGERRYRGMQECIRRGLIPPDSDKLSVPVIIDHQGKTDRERTIEMFVLNSGKELNALEQAAGIQRLLDMGETEETLPRLIGKSSTHIQGCLMLAAAAPDVIDAVSKGLLSSTTAIDLTREVSDLAEQERFLREAAANANAAGSDRITAKHFPIPLGKAAQKARADKLQRERNEFIEQLVLDAKEIIRAEQKFSLCMLQKASKIGHDDAVEVLRILEERGVLEPDEDESGTKLRKILLNAAPENLQDGELGNGATNDFGEYETYGQEPLDIAAGGVHGKIFIAEDEGRFHYGYEIKWPGQAKGDGYLKVMPKRKGPHAPDYDRALIAGIMAVRGELEAKEFKSKVQALEGLDEQLAELTKDLPASTPPAENTLPNPVIPPSGEGQGNEGDDEGNGEQEQQQEETFSMRTATATAAADHLRTVLAALPKGDCEKIRLAAANKVQSWLTGKLDDKGLGRWLIGID